jgi:hypothetical protein
MHGPINIIEKGDISRYWVTLRKGNDADTGHGKRKQWIAVCKELALRDTMDLS